DDRILEFAPNRERPEIATCGQHIFQSSGRGLLRTSHGESCGRVFATEIYADMRIANVIVIDNAGERLQRDSAPAGRTIGARREFIRLARSSFEELRARNHFVNQAPFDRALAPDSLFGSAEKIRPIAAHSTLVD